MTATVPRPIADAARRWLAEDPDPDTRDELARLLEVGEASAELADRFGHHLEFGTAGLRAPMGAGPNRMNVTTVRFAAAGLARHLIGRGLGGDVVIGYDRRHKSDLFAKEAALVIAGHGLRARLLPTALPTPVLAFAVCHLGCAAGVMVTASHNPPADNGFKVYGADGAQIIPPIDHEIAEHIGQLRSLGDVPLADSGSPLVEVLGDSVLDHYLNAAASLRLPSARDVAVVYTPLHGVGGEPFLALLERAGFPTPRVVSAQAEPDPGFPTTPFPNPEEPGVLDLALSEAERRGADLVLAHDPDADRLAVAVPTPEGWRRLSGDEVGVLLAECLLGPELAMDGRRALLTTTVVSSRLLSKLAAHAGAAYAETLTGFKWLVRPALEHPELRPVLAYEEALGYSIGDVVRDKDGLTAGLAFAAVAADLAQRGNTVSDRLEQLSRRFGHHATMQWPIRIEQPQQWDAVRARIAALRSAPPRSLAGRRVTRFRDLLVDHEPGTSSVGGPLASADVIIFELGEDARIVMRPSGTEPKLKIYLECVIDVPRDDQRLGSTRAVAERELQALRAAAGELLEC